MYFTYYYFQSTSLHGYHYLYMDHSAFYNVIWFIAILAMTALGIGFLVINTQSYLKARLVTTIDKKTAPLSVSFN